MDALARTDNPMRAIEATDAAQPDAEPADSGSKTSHVRPPQGPTVDGEMEIDINPHSSPNRCWYYCISHANWKHNSFRFRLVLLCIRKLCGRFVNVHKCTSVHRIQLRSDNVALEMCIGYAAVTRSLIGAISSHKCMCVHTNWIRYSLRIIYSRGRSQNAKQSPQSARSLLNCLMMSLHSLASHHHFHMPSHRHRRDTSHHRYHLLCTAIGNGRNVGQRICTQIMQHTFTQRWAWAVQPRYMLWLVIMACYFVYQRLGVMFVCVFVYVCIVWSTNLKTSHHIHFHLVLRVEVAVHFMCGNIYVHVTTQQHTINRSIELGTVNQIPHATNCFRMLDDSRGGSYIPVIHRHVWCVVRCSLNCMADNCGWIPCQCACRVKISTETTSSRPTAIAMPTKLRKCCDVCLCISSPPPRVSNSLLSITIIRIIIIITL